MTIVLGFGNKARQGKDTAAEAVVAFGLKNDIPVLKLGFADALRNEVTEAIRANGGDVNDLLLNGPEPGISFPSWVIASPNPDMSDPLLPYGKHSKILQWWGTEYRRAQSENYWVDIVKQKVVGFNGVVAISDMRFINEAIATLELGGVTVNIRRLNEDGTQYFCTARDPGHQSETDLDDWNWDFRIIAKTGQGSFVKMQAVSVLKYQLNLKNGVSW
jgi:hypothetical protein